MRENVCMDKIHCMAHGMGWCRAECARTHTHVLSAHSSILFRKLRFVFEQTKRTYLVRRSHSTILCMMMTMEFDVDFPSQIDKIICKLTAPSVWHTRVSFNIAHVKIREFLVLSKYGPIDRNGKCETMELAPIYVGINWVPIQR